MTGCGVWSVQPEPKLTDHKHYLKIFDHYEFQRRRNFTLSFHSKVMLANYIDNNQKNLDQDIFHITQSIFQRVFVGSIAAEQQQRKDLETSLNIAAKMKADYLFLMVPGQSYSGILLQKKNCRLESRALELPGGVESETEINTCDWKMDNPLDSVGLSFWVFAVSQKKLIDVAELKTQSGMLTWFLDSPQKLIEKTLPKLLATYSGQ